MLLCRPQDQARIQVAESELPPVVEPALPYSISEQVRIPMTLLAGAHRPVPRAALRAAARDSLPVGGDDPRLHPPDVPAVPARAPGLRLRQAAVVDGGAPVRSGPDGLRGVEARHPAPVPRAGRQDHGRLQRHRRTAVCSSRPTRTWSGSAPATSSRDPFVLYVGNIKPHKNLERLIEAFHQLRQESAFEDAEARHHRRRDLEIPRRCAGPCTATSCTSTCGSSASSRSTRWRCCTGWRACSSFLRCTKASACRRSRRWPAARRSSRRTSPRCPEVVGDAAMLVDPVQTPSRLPTACDAS